MNSADKDELHDYLKTVIASYEDRLRKIQTAFQSSEVITESAYTLLDYVRHSLNEQKKEREALNSELREILAGNGSVRKKDYNEIIADIFYILDEKEKEAESKFNAFIKAQKSMAELLKNSLLNLKNITSQDAADKITAIHRQLASISEEQEKNKDTVLNAFREFQRMHNHIMEYLRNLLNQGNNIGIRDIKKIRDRIYNETGTPEETMVKSQEK